MSTPFVGSLVMFPHFQPVKSFPPPFSPYFLLLPGDKYQGSTGL